MEEWKTIDNYPNYQISNLGRVKSLTYRNTNTEKILKTSKNNSGYLLVFLSKEGKHKGYLIHRLVAQAFIPNHSNKPCIDHKDNNRLNNRVENLRWVTHKENSNNPLTKKNLSESKMNVYQGVNNPNYGNRGKLNPISKPVIQFDKNNNFIRKWDSVADVQREPGFHQSSISSCCRGERKSAHNYKWGYAEDYERIPFKVFDIEMYEKKKVA